MWIHLPPLEDGEAPTDEDNHSASLEYTQRKLGMSEGLFSPQKVQMTPQLPRKDRVTTLLPIISIRWDESEFS